MKQILLLFAVMFCAIHLNAQRNITGNVSAENGEALIGASVLVTGSTIGTITDLDGNFALEVPDGSNSLTVSYTGFATEEVDYVFNKMKPAFEKKIEEFSSKPKWWGTTNASDL